MRTTYKPKNVKPKVEKSSVSGEKVYLEILNAMDIMKSEEDYSENEHFSKVKGKQLPAGKPKKSKLPVILVSIIVLLIISVSVVSLLLVNYYKSTDLTKISAEIDNLYVSQAQNSIKEGVTKDSLEVYYSELKGMKEKRKSLDTSELEKELNTIGYYIEDMELVQSYLSEDYNLATKGLSKSLDSVEKRLKTYSVSGLALSVNDALVQVRNNYDYYVSVKEELSNVKDIFNFNSLYYNEKINCLTYTVNYKELKKMIEKLEADRNLALSQLTLAQLQEDDNAETEVIEKAQKDWDEAKIKQSDAIKALELVKKEVEGTMDSKKAENTEESMSK